MNPTKFNRTNSTYTRTKVYIESMAKKNKQIIAFWEIYHKTIGTPHICQRFWPVLALEYTRPIFHILRISLGKVKYLSVFNSLSLTQMIEVIVNDIFIMKRMKDKTT